MPGEEAFLDEFVEEQFSARRAKLLGQLVRRVFDPMNLAGEAGSLLKIEEEIATPSPRRSSSGTQARKPRTRPSVCRRHCAPAEQEETAPRPHRHHRRDSFWERAEERIYDALQAYAEQAENGGGFQRRLFADDAAQGFAFIDLCRKRYDVVVMNPPFGEAGLLSRDYLYGTYSHAAQDIFSALSTAELGSFNGRSGRCNNVTTRLLS